MPTSAGLSTRQVKLVLAAAMWSRPHLLVLDEPTNYLDREALGALTAGIKDFGGGVIIISHNSEFLTAITTETWLLEGGRLKTTGAAEEVRECWVVSKEVHVAHRKIWSSQATRRNIGTFVYLYRLPSGYV